MDNMDGHCCIAEDKLSPVFLERITKLEKQLEEMDSHLCANIARTQRQGESLVALKALCERLADEVAELKK